MPTINAKASKLIDAEIAKSPAFAQPICRKLRTIIRKADPEIVEDWKWGPNYNKNGMVCGFGAFKAHVALAFFKGSLMKDSKKIFDRCGDAVGSRRIYFKSVDEVEEKTLTAYVREAVKLNDSGVKVARHKAALPMPADFDKSLTGKARKNFDAMTPGYQREYIEWIAQAKRPETRRERVEKAVSQLASDLTLHYKYR